MKPPPLRPSFQAISFAVRRGEWRFCAQICLLLTIPLLANGNVNFLKKHENGSFWLDNDHAYKVFPFPKSTEIAPIVNLNTHRHLTSFDYDESESEANNDVIKAEANSLENDSLSLKELLDQVERLQEETYRSERIFYAFAYGLIVVLSFFGNLLVCRVCLRNMTKTNALILSLAGSDLIMSCLNIPFTYFRIFSVNYSWPFGSAMCFIVNFVQHMVVYVSSYTMAIIAIQRYRSICGLQFETSKTATSRSSINGYNCQLSASKVASRVGRWFAAMCHSCTPFTLCRQRPSRRQQIYSLRPIIISILVTWLLSAVISTLFTYSAAVVESPNISAEICSHYSRLAKVRTSQAKLPNLVEPEMHPSCSLVMLRCQNPVPARVEKFLASYSIKADLAKTIVVFVTQYFIPLTISCVLYIRIGKIISKQGKLATLQSKIVLDEMEQLCHGPPFTLLIFTFSIMQITLKLVFVRRKSGVA